MRVFTVVGKADRARKLRWGLGRDGCLLSSHPFSFARFFGSFSLTERLAQATKMYEFFNRIYVQLASPHKIREGREWLYTG